MHTGREGMSAMPYFDDFDLSTVDILLISQYVSPLLDLPKHGSVQTPSRARGRRWDEIKSTHSMPFGLRPARHCNSVSVAQSIQHCFKTVLSPCKQIAPAMIFASACARLTLKRSCSTDISSSAVSILTMPPLCHMCSQKPTSKAASS